MKTLTITFLSLFFSISSLANENEVEAPTWLQVNTVIQPNTQCDNYIENLASDLLTIRDAISNAETGIYFNESVGADYSRRFKEEGVRLSQAREALNTLFSKAMDCNSTSGKLKSSN